MKTLKINAFLTLALSAAMFSCNEEELKQDKVEDSKQSTIEMETAAFESQLGLIPLSDGETSEPGKTDCSFSGVIEVESRIGHLVAVDNIPIKFGKDAVATWTINGAIVKPRRPRYVVINDYVSVAGAVEVCYSVTSKDCGTLGECTTVDFEG